VKAKGEDKRIGEGVRDGVGVQKGGNLSLPSHSGKTFTDVENHIPAPAPIQRFHQGEDVPDSLGSITKIRQRLFDALDGVGSIKFRRFFLAPALGEVIRSEIVGKSKG